MARLVEMEYNGQLTEVWFPKTATDFGNGILEVTDDFWGVKEAELAARAEKFAAGKEMVRIKIKGAIAETDKAFGFDANINNLDVERSWKRKIWLPKSQVKREGDIIQAPKWLLDSKWKELVDENKGRGSVTIDVGYDIIGGAAQAKEMKTMAKWAAERDAFILKLQSGAEAEVAALQRQLFDRLYDKAIAAMQTENGVVLFNEANMATVARLNELFDGFTRASQGVAGKIGESLIDISLMGVDYAETMGIDRNEIARIVEKLDLMQQRLGVKVVSEAGKDIVKVQPGGYIDTLAQSDKVKADIASYVTRSVAGKASLSEYSTGLRDLVEGAEDADGALLKYYKTYAWDSYHEVEAETNNFFADEMGLEWFVYQGDVIDDSRPFCVEHAGKVYNRDDAARFDTMEWQGKKPGPFLVERGGYNCRHMIDWISEETAMMMKEGGL